MYVIFINQSLLSSQCDSTMAGFIPYTHAFLYSLMQIMKRGHVIEAIYRFRDKWNKILWNALLIWHVKCWSRGSSCCLTAPRYQFLDSLHVHVGFCHLSCLTPNITRIGSTTTLRVYWGRMNNVFNIFLLYFSIIEQYTVAGLTEGLKTGLRSR